MMFRPLPPGAPALALNESGEDMMLTIAFVGRVEYYRQDSAALAKHLRAAADMVEAHA